VFLVLQREKEASGLADVPGGSKGKLLEVEFAFTEDRKLRGQLRDPGAIEAQVSGGFEQPCSNYSASAWAVDSLGLPLS
jgi:hypothetical protein